MCAVGPNSRSAKAERFHLTDSCRRYPNILVGGTIIEKPSIAVQHLPLDKHDVWNLPNLFPVVHGFKDWLLGPSNRIGGISFVKQYPAGSIHAVIVRPVINQENAMICDTGRGSGSNTWEANNLGRAGKTGWS